MDVFVMHYNYRENYLVVVIDSIVCVYKYKFCKLYSPLFSFRAKNIFISKSKICPMTEFSEARDKNEFDGNTFLLECEDNEYKYISGIEITKFNTNDKIIEYISLIGNSMCSYAIMIGERYTYFTAHHYKII